jgi:5'-nucleotidase
MMHLESQSLVIGVSSRALFSLEEENRIFEEQGPEAYSKYQIQHEDEPLKPGVAFPLIKAFLHLNNSVGREIAEVVLMSRNNPDVTLRIFNSFKYHHLNIQQAALSSGASLAPYLSAFKVDLFLSAYEEDVRMANRAGVAAALVYSASKDYQTETDIIRIAFDGDAVVFSDEADKVYQDKGLDEFIKHERDNARNPLPEGPFAKLLKTISYIQSQFSDPEKAPIRTALVTARNIQVHERVIRTLRDWKVRIDEAFFMSGADKTAVLEAFKPHMFFDDQVGNVDRASSIVPSAMVR